MLGLEIAILMVSPIAVDECRVANTRSYVSVGNPLALGFTNLRATPADEVHFSVEYAGRTEHVVDRGTFSQNVRIGHAFSGFFNARYQGAPPSCTIDYVEFADGTVWTTTAPTSNQATSPPAQFDERTSEWIVATDHLFGGRATSRRPPASSRSGFGATDELMSLRA